MNAGGITREAVIATLARHIGEANGVHIHALVAEIRVDPVADERAEREVRLLIETLRREGLHICAWPRVGYFMAEKPEELDRTCEWLYARAMTSITQVARMRRVALPDLRGQLRLPT